MVLEVILVVLGVVLVVLGVVLVVLGGSRLSFLMKRFLLKGQEVYASTIHQCCQGTRLYRMKHPSLTPTSWFTS